MLWQGESLFSLLLAVAFTYLALKSVNSFARFALVAGVVVAGSLGVWVGRLLADSPVSRRPAAGWAVRCGMLACLAACLAAVAGERYARWTGDPRRLALRERPLTFAHDAARFAGQSGMPRHALVYDIAQSCVYVYHNAPDGKVYMDARLETPTEKTFRHYIQIEDWLNTNDRRWAGALKQLGNPALVLSHESNALAEAVVLADPEWRCVYFDALAAVFLHRGTTELEGRFPTVDPLLRHFRQGRGPSQPEVPGAAWKEAKALYNLATSLRQPESLAWQRRIPWLLAAVDRAELALEEDPQSAGVWTVLGNCYWNMIPDLRAPPPSSSDPWDPTNGLPWAQSTYCFRQALQRAAKDERVLLALFRSFGIRRMSDAQREIAPRLLEHAKLNQQQTSSLRRIIESIDPPRRFTGPLTATPEGTLPALLAAQRPEEATRLAEQLRQQGSGVWPWPLADRLAGACLHLGKAAQARQVWEQAKDPPSEALRRGRLASTYWIERDFASAIVLYQDALREDSQSGEPCWALAWLFTQRGEADEALRACRQARQRQLSERARSDMEALEKLLAPYATRNP
jgi:tetratricopeptide (TPR) repeat protein